MKHAAVMMLLSVVLAGCSFLAPGKDLREASEAQSETIWGADNTLTLRESTTHNRRVVAVESTASQPASVEYYADGTPKKITNGTNIITQCSEPRDVMQTMIQRDIQNAKVTERMLDVVSGALAIVGARQAGKTQVELIQASQPAGESQADIVREILGAFRGGG